MITIDEVFPIGQISKSHGINGEMSFEFTTDIFDTQDISFFILEVEGILVPFFIDEYRFKTAKSGLLKLGGVDTEEQTRELIGLTIYIQKKYIEMVENNEIEVDYFVGFSLVDVQHGIIGIINEVDQTTENTLFVIGEGDDEILIPVGDDYIVEVDHDNKIIQVNLPEGLLEL
jgi:16S rRNA processing protein RimM